MGSWQATGGRAADGQLGWRAAAGSRFDQIAAAIAKEARAATTDVATRWVGMRTTAHSPAGAAAAGVAVASGGFGWRPSIVTPGALLAPS